VCFRHKLNLCNVHVTIAPSVWLQHGCHNSQARSILPIWSVFGYLGWTCQDLKSHLFGLSFSLWQLCILYYSALVVVYTAYCALQIVLLTLQMVTYKTQWLLQYIKLHAVVFVGIFACASQYVTTYIVCCDQESNSKWNKTNSDSEQQRQYWARRQYRLPCRQPLLLELCVYSKT